MFNKYSLAFLLGILLASGMVACSGAPSAPAASAPTSAPIAANAAPTTLPAAPTLSNDAPAIITATPETDDSSASQAAGFQKLNLNTASAQDFLTIPGVSNRMVREFQEYRPYVSIQQFRKEIGKYVDEQQVAEYEKYVFVPIAINDADAATLQQIPGVDGDKAAQLIAARPYATNDAFLTKLASFVSPDQIAVAKTYLSSQ